MANASTEDAALHDNMRLLRMLATDPAAQQGLRLVMQAGRRHGLDTAMFAGVTMSSSHSPAAEKAQGQPKVGSTGNERPRAPATGSPASASRPRRRKSAAKQRRGEVRGQEDDQEISCGHAPGAELSARAAAAAAAAATARGRGGAPAVSGASSWNSRHFTGDAGGAGEATATRIRMSTT